MLIIKFIIGGISSIPWRVKSENNPDGYADAETAKKEMMNFSHVEALEISMLLTKANENTPVGYFVRAVCCTKLNKGGNIITVSRKPADSEIFIHYLG